MITVFRVVVVCAAGDSGSLPCLRHARQDYVRGQKIFLAQNGSLVTFTLQRTLHTCHVTVDYLMHHQVCGRGFTLHAGRVGKRELSCEQAVSQDTYMHDLLTSMREMISCDCIREHEHVTHTTSQMTDLDS